MAGKPGRKSAVVYGITQDELETYRCIAADAKRYQADLELRRKSLLARHDAGATVQPGPLAPQITVTEVRRFSADEVARIMGLEVVAEIRTQLTPSIERRFSVIDTGRTQ